MMTQGDLLDVLRVVAVVLSPLCPYQRHCRSRADIGPCAPVSADCCNHPVTCQACGRQGTESWNLTVGSAAHAQTRGGV